MSTTNGPTGASAPAACYIFDGSADALTDRGANGYDLTVEYGSLGSYVTEGDGDLTGLAFAGNTRLNNSSPAACLVTGAVTIEILFRITKLSANGTHGQYFVTTGQENSESSANNILYGVHLPVSTPGLYIMQEHGGGVNEILQVGDHVVGTDDIVHSVWTRDATGKELAHYIDGASQGATSYSFAPTGGASGHLHIGGNHNSGPGPSRYLCWATIFGVRITAEEWTTTQVAEAYQNLLGGAVDFTETQGEHYNIYALIDGHEPVLWRHSHYGEPTNWSRSIKTCLVKVTEHADTLDLAEMKAGVDAMTFWIREVEDTDGTNYFGKLFAPSRYNTGGSTDLPKASSPRKQLDADATTITVLAADNLPAAPSEAHIGQETFSYTGKSGDDLTGVTRGLYPCVGNNWSYTFARPESGKGLSQLVSEYPFTWLGRRIALYATAWDQASGDWVGENQSELLWVGRVSNKMVNKGKSGHWVLSAESILTELGNKELNANPAHSTLKWINLQGDRGREFHIRIWRAHDSGFSFTPGGYLGIDVEVPKGKYTINTLISKLNQLVAVGNWTNTASIGVSIEFYWASVQNETKIFAETAQTGSYKFLFNWSEPKYDGFCHVANALGLHGAEGITYVESQLENGDRTQIHSGKPFAAYHPLARECNGDRLYVETGTAPRFHLDQGDGATQHANVGIEKATLSRANQFEGTYFARYVNWWVSQNDDYLELDQVHSPEVDDTGFVGFSFGEKLTPVKQAWIPRWLWEPNATTHIGRGPFELLLYPLLSTGTKDYNDSTYDKLPLALSVGVQAALVDKQSFIDADLAIAKTDLWNRRFYLIAWETPIDWMALASRECKLFGYAIVWRNSKITCLPVTSPDRAGASVTIDESVRAAKDEFPDQDVGIQTVLNQYNVSIEFNPATGKYGPEIVIQDVNSITGTGVTKKTEIKHPGIQITNQVESGFDILEQHFETIKLLRLPTGVVNVTLAHTLLKRIWVGDIVTFQSSTVSDPFGSGTRTTSTLATVVALRWTYSDNLFIGNATLLLHSWAQVFGIAWSPAAAIDYTVHGGDWNKGYNEPSKQLALVTHEFGDEDNDPQDGAAVAPVGDEELRLVERAPSSPATTYRIAAIAPYGTNASNILSINDTLPGWDGNQYIIEPAPYSEATAAQRNGGAYMANSTTLLLNAITIADRWG